MSVRDKLVKVTSIIIDNNLCTGGGQKTFWMSTMFVSKTSKIWGFFILFCKAFFFLLWKNYFSSSSNIFQQFNTNIFPTHERNLYPYLGIGALVNDDGWWWMMKHNCVRNSVVLTVLTKSTYYLNNERVWIDIIKRGIVFTNI